MIEARDEAVIAAQLGRPPRSIHDIGHRCPCGNPDVVATEPRLEDGTPFPTTFYLTCPRAASLIGTLEASGLMKEMTERLEADPELAAAYERAHEAYLAFREGIGHVPEIAGVSAGGMPTRVKCLHVLAGQALAQGRGVNPLGDEVLDLLGEFWGSGPCVTAAPADAPAAASVESARTRAGEPPSRREREPGNRRVGANASRGAVESARTRAEEPSSRREREPQGREGDA